MNNIVYEMMSLMRIVLGKYVTSFSEQKCLLGLFGGSLQQRMTMQLPHIKQPLFLAGEKHIFHLIYSTKGKVKNWLVFTGHGAQKRTLQLGVPIPETKTQLNQELILLTPHL